MDEMFIYLIALAVTVGLIMWAGNRFRLTLDVGKVTISSIAAYAAAWMIQQGVLPFLIRKMASLSSGLQLIVQFVVIFGLPLLVLTACLTIVVNLKKNESQALAFCGWGGALVTCGVLLLITIKQPPPEVKDLETLKIGCWVIAGLGVALMGAGYYLGTLLTPSATTLRGDDVMHTINAVTSQDWNEPTRNRPTEGQAPTVVPGAKRSSVQAWIIILSGESKNTRFDLHQGDMKIGRSGECDIRVTGDPEVSREHALVRVQGPSYQLHDTASRSGTLLNGAPVTAPRSLHDGDEIKVGQTTLLFQKVKVTG